jgi:hypothetical protein
MKSQKMTAPTIGADFGEIEMNVVPAKVPTAGEIMEDLIIKGDLAKLTGEQRAKYYVSVCKSLGLNELTKPFDYLQLSGKLTLYANRTCADQLRKINGISIEIASQKIINDILTVHVKARDRDGRSDEDIGAVPFPDTLRGDARANQILKAVTKAKRRVTLSISGLGWFDETEAETIADAHKVEIDDEIPEPKSYQRSSRRLNESEPEDRITDELIAQAKRENETDIVKQCGIRCADPRFHKFLEETNDGWRLLNKGTPTERAAELVRAIVGVKSRKDITPGSEAAEHWHDLEGRFQAWLRA